MHNGVESRTPLLGTSHGHYRPQMPLPSRSSTVLLNLANRLRRGHRHALVLRVALKLGPEFTHYSHYGSYMPSTKSNLGTRDVGRPTKWGNPYKVGASHHTAEEAVNPYRRDLIAGSLPFTIDDVRWELRGRDLVCWCKLGAPCHADTLIVVANF
jgi:hypothetical protein